MNISCPNCGTDLELPDDVENGQHLECPDCSCRFFMWNGECRILSSSTVFVPYPDPSIGRFAGSSNSDVYEMTTVSEYRNFAWRRWAARTFDGCLGVIFANIFVYIFVFLLPFVLCMFVEDSSALSFLNWLAQPQHVWCCNLFGVGIAYFSDVAVFAVFGQTLGKKICGIRICDPNGNPISRWGYFGRAWGVLLLGLGLMLPLVALGTQLWQAYRVGKGLPAAYDEGRLFQARSIRGKRASDPALVVAAIVVPFFALAVAKSLLFGR